MFTLYNLTKGENKLPYASWQDISKLSNRLKSLVLVDILLNEHRITLYIKIYIFSYNALVNCSGGAGIREHNLTSTNCSLTCSAKESQYLYSKCLNPQFHLIVYRNKGKFLTCIGSFVDFVEWGMSKREQLMH